MLFLKNYKFPKTCLKFCWIFVKHILLLCFLLDVKSDDFNFAQKSSYSCCYFSLFISIFMRNYFNFSSLAVKLLDLACFSKNEHAVT